MAGTTATGSSTTTTTPPITEVNAVEYSPVTSSPSSASDTLNIPSIRNPSPSKHNLTLSDTISNISSQPIIGFPKPQTQFQIHDPINNGLIATNVSYPTAYPITKQQLSLLLVNDLQQRRNTNRSIDVRLTQDEQTFKEIEHKLEEKIKKYEKRNSRKIQYKDSTNDDIKEDYLNDLLDRIIDLDYETNEIKRQIRKKKWYEDRNALYRKISENNVLMKEIDNITQKIDYWQQMIAVTASNGPHRNSNLNSNSRTTNKTNSNITPFVVKEALRIKSENEKTLSDLRVQLDEIRAQRPN